MLKIQFFSTTCWGVPFARISASICLTFSLFLCILTKGHSQTFLFRGRSAWEFEGDDKIPSDFSKFFFSEEVLLRRQISP